MNLFLPALGWPHVIIGCLLLSGLILAGVSRRLRTRKRGGRLELCLFVAGTALVVLAAVLGWLIL